MNPNSAYRLVKIEKGVNYAPSIVERTDGSQAMNGPVIYALLCTKSGSGSGSVNIRTIGNVVDGTDGTDIPYTTFKEGVTYHFYVVSIKNVGDGIAPTFVGLQYRTAPMVL